MSNFYNRIVSPVKIHTSASTFAIDINTCEGCSFMEFFWLELKSLLLV